MRYRWSEAPWAGLWTPLLLVLLLSLIVTGVMAQEDGTRAGDEPVFVENGDAALPENIDAAAGEVWIPVTKDAYVASGDPSRNFGFDQLMRFGFTPGGLGATRPLFKYKVEDYLPSDAKIEKAELHVYLTNNRDSDTSRGYAAHNLTQSWDEGFVTWNTMPSYGPEIGRGILGNTPGWQVTDITAQVRDWTKNPQNNKGVILVGDERPDQNFERDYFAKETTSGLYPRLFVRFDVNQDDVPPVARVVQPSAGAWSPADLVVRWEGNDPPNSNGSPGSGIRWYDVFYTTNGGSSWKVGRAQVTSTETNVTGAGHLTTMGFYARARDNAGNEGPAPSGSGSVQTWTRIDAQAPEATMNPLPEVTPHSSFSVSWRDSKEQNESGIRYFDVQYREVGGDWQQLVYHTTATSTTFTRGENGKTYEFRARGVDNVGNEQAWGDPQAETTVWTEPLADIVPFNPPIYQKKAGPAVGDGFTVRWEGFAPPGSSIVAFDIDYQKPNSTTWLRWITGTNQTSATFELQVGDPDGTYIFRARARDSAGNQGGFHEELYGRIIVDRQAPFIEPQALMPVVLAD